MANPNIEIRVDPGSGENSGVRRNNAGGGDRFRRGERPKILISVDSAVKFAQEFAAISGIVFPGVFAVQKQANREWLRGLHAFA